MKHLVYILLGLMLVGVFSCRRSPGGTEARLVAIDSLITAEPDSALALLADINADSLPADLRAYHDVLTTQALYKAYIPATTDTLIARAWSYYRDHGPYDRRIRAMLYSGTTAEELGRPDSAMRWYKRTELESRPDDHYHRAYALMSMGAVYQSVYEIDNTITKYKDASAEFKFIGDTTSMLFCEFKLCQAYMKSEYDSALFHANYVQHLALQANADEYTALISLLSSSYLFYDGNYSAAKDSTLQALNRCKEGSFATWCRLAICYAKLNQFDSAQYYMKHATTPLDVNDSILYYQYKSELCKYMNDIDGCIKYEKLSNDIAADEMVQSKDNHYQQIEFEEIKRFRNKMHGQQILSAFAVVILFILIGIGVHIFIYKKKRRKLESEIDQLQSFSDKLQILNKDLKLKYEEILSQQIAQEPDNTESESSDYLAETSVINSKRFYEIITSLSESFRFIITQTRRNIRTEKDLKKLDSTIGDTLTPRYFEHLREFVDFAYSGLVSEMIKSGKLNDKEINVICMYLCRLPNTIIKIYLGHANISNTIRYRNKIANKYFGSKESLERMLTNMHF